MRKETIAENCRTHIVVLFLRALLVAVLLATVSTAWAASYSKLVVFGDSLSDVGNANIVTGGQALPPPYYQGRASNGPLWVEDLAQSLGVPSARPFLEDGTGTNFAAGSTTTGPMNPPTPYEQFHMVNVVGMYLNTVSGCADPNALYILWSGANDFFTKIDADPTHSAASCTSYLSTWAGNVSGAVDTLRAAGAVNFLVPNLPPLGSTPKLNSNPDRVAINAAVGDFNSMLSADLSELQATYSGLSIQRLDVYGLFNQVLANPTAYGFDNVTNQAMTTPGADPDRYLFWDYVHPTAAGHALLAQSVPEPSSVMLLAIGGGLLLLIGRYRRSSCSP